jgi:uncharacterized membrane protein YcaP (DUF421 family)
MKKEEIHLWDIKRILFGQAPPEFLIEVFIRTLIIYIAAMVVMRWLGKRMNGQLTITEFAIMVTMGAIISVPMQLPDRGLIQGFVALLCTLLFLLGINWWSIKRRKFERLAQGDLCILVKDGVLQMREMESSRISKNQLFAVLRSKEIYHLGKVKRMYIEACGIFSIYQDEAKKPGLPVFPPDDKSLLSLYEKESPTDNMACTNCGTVQQLEVQGDRCKNCGHKEWTKAIL